MKLSCKIKVKNSQGLHARPATAIVRLLQDSQSSVTFTYHNETVNAKSIMGILMLAAGKHAVITVDIEGDDAEEVMKKLSSAFEKEFEG